MIEIKQSATTIALLFRALDIEGDPLLAAAPVVTLSKNGATFVPAAGIPSEVGSGIYKLAPTAADTSAIGSLALAATVTGGKVEPMLYQIVTHTRAEVMSAIAALNNLSAAAVRSELTPELDLIDVAISTRNATTPPTAAANAAAVRNDLAAEMGRIDVAVSTRTATEPDNAGISAIRSAVDGAAQILTTAPYVPIVGPVAIIPAPVDPEMVTCYLDSQGITGGEDTTLKIVVRIQGNPPTIASLQYLVQKPAMMIHQADEPGQYRIDLPRGLNFHVNCAGLFGVNGKIITTPLTGDSLNIVTS